MSYVWTRTQPDRFRMHEGKSMSILNDEQTKQVDKIEKYGWAMKNSPGQFLLVDKRSLLINDEYQRDAVSPKVLSIARNWNWIACGVILVAKRDGALSVMDGQHRVLAARKRSDITQLPCMVFETETVAEEAKGFLDVNTGRKAVSAVSKHKAYVVAGDNMAVTLQLIFDEAGLVVTNNANVPGQIRCVALARLLATENLAEFSYFLPLISRICKSEESVISETLLSGLWYIHRQVPNGLRDERLVKRVEAVGTELLVAAAKRAAAFYAKGGAKVYAQGMLEALNKGLRMRFEFK